MINLKFQYKQLISIKVAHNYYSEGASNDFYIVPTPRTVKLIEKMSMLVRTLESEIHILFDASKLELLHHRLSNSNDSESKFSFMLFANNPYFVNITDIPVDLNNKIFYCSNKNIGINKSGVLHSNEFVGDEDLFNVIPQELENDENYSINYKIALENGEIEEEMPVSQIDNGYQVNSSNLLEGHYKIFGNDKELSSFINIGSKTKGSPVGFIDVFLNKNIKQELLKEIDNGELNSFNYKINFNSRSIFWKYIVVPTYLKRIKELSLTCQKGKEKLDFDSIKDEGTSENQAMIFITKKPVKFSKFYDYEIQLKKKEGATGGKTIIKKMPYAPFDLLKPFKEDFYLSEIYVYI
jgi:hypothetical protein